MGPHVFACGNRPAASLSHLRPKLQWGRTFLRAEISIGSSELTKMCSFNGAARFCVRKSVPPSSSFCFSAALQWGRTFLRAEIRGIHGCVRALDRFNGAARFCVRKWRRSLRDAARRSSASMGPHVFACGNLGIRCSARFARPALQWGRTFLRAEMRATYSVSVDVDRLQWGRTFLRAEIVRYV